MPTDGGALSVERFDFATADPELAQSKIDELYVTNRLQRPDGEGFAMMVSRCTVGGLWMDRVRFSGSLSVHTGPFPRVWFGFVRGGLWSGATRGEELRGRAGLAYAHPMHNASVYTLRDVDACTVALPAEAVRQAAAEQFGHDRVRFLAMAPVDTDMQDYWRTMADFAREQLCVPDSSLREPLVLAQMINLLATVALATFPNTTMTADYLPGPGDVGPATLRRAVAFIDAHAESPLTLSDIASAAGVSPRALQNAFRRHRGTTPFGYLRRVRLERAHRDLLAADPTGDDTLAVIARRWGFPTRVRFAALYRESYGHTPDQTLSRRV